MAKHNQIGALGESIASKWLRDQGFEVVDRNYRKKWGEIDIVARETVKNSQKIRFVEVKTVSYETRHDLDYAVTHETWRPEEMVHTYKLEKLHRAIQTWVAEHNFKGEYQLDVLTVRLVPREKYAKVNLIEKVIIEP